MNQLPQAIPGMSPLLVNLKLLTHHFRGDITWKAYSHIDFRYGRRCLLSLGQCVKQDKRKFSKRISVTMSNSPPGIGQSNCFALYFEAMLQSGWEHEHQSPAWSLHWNLSREFLIHGSSKHGSCSVFSGRKHKPSGQRRV